MRVNDFPFHASDNLDAKKNSLTAQSFNGAINWYYGNCSVWPVLRTFQLKPTCEHSDGAWCISHIDVRWLNWVKSICLTICILIKVLHVISFIWYFIIVHCGNRALFCPIWVFPKWEFAHYSRIMMAFLWEELAAIPRIWWENPLPLTKGNFIFFSHYTKVPLVGWHFFVTKIAE